MQPNREFHVKQDPRPETQNSHFLVRGSRRRSGSGGSRRRSSNNNNSSSRRSTNNNNNTSRPFVIRPVFVYPGGVARVINSWCLTLCGIRLHSRCPL